jgi:hypothetical protein
MLARILFAVFFALLFAKGSAQARPRDDVMAGLFQCNGLQDDRQWLDCYYGAAQPARVSLGLKPALPAQVQLAQSPSKPSGNVPSPVRSGVVADAGRCYDEGSDRDWLDCYYRAALPMRKKLGLPVAAVNAVRPSPASGDFGLRQSAESESPRNTVNSIASRMIDYSFDAQMIFTIRLENGQTWRQIDGDSHIARWKKPANTYLVTIRRGMSRSFVMTVSDEPRVFRVHRIN